MSFNEFVNKEDFLAYQDMEHFENQSKNNQDQLSQGTQQSIREAIALLTDKSLPHWPKTIQRLLEHNRPTA